jgi:tetratricopeptide (TPR) repeat protein
MKKNGNLIFGLLFVITVCPSTHGNGKKDNLSLDAAIKTTAKEISGSFNSGARIAVVKFESPATRLGDYIMEELNGALIQDKRLLVVDRANIEYLEKELKYQKENISEEAAKNIGKWLGAELIVVGSLDNIGDTYRYRVYTINVEKAAREAATMLSVSNDSSFKNLLSGLQNNSNTVAVRSYGGTSNTAPAKSAGDYLNAGITSGIKGDFTNAIANCDQAIKLDPNFALAYLQRGKAIYARLVKITGMDANFDFGSYTTRVIASVEEKTHCQNAIKDFSRAIQLEGTLIAAYDYRGRTSDLLGEYDNAIMDYSQAIKLDPNEAAAYNGRGNSYNSKGDYDKAIADYGQAIKMNPNYALAYNNRGISHGSKGDHDKAIADFSWAIKLDPNDMAAYNNRGNSYNRKGDYDKAIADYGQAIKIDPNLVTSYNNRGISYNSKADYDKAIGDFSQAIKLDPNYAETYFNRGISYGRKGDYDKAIADYDQAIKLDPNYASAYLNRGVSYYNKGDKEKAISDFEKVIQIDPNDTAAKNNLKALRGW